MPTLASDRIVVMREGDLVFIPHGSSHWIADAPESSRVAAAEFTRARRAGLPVFGGGGEKTVLIGGHFQFEDEPLHPLLRNLPSVIHISEFEAENATQLRNIAELLLVEMSRERPGSKIILSSLAEMLFILVIRCYMETDENLTGFWAAVNDERIGMSLKIMQDSFHRDWSMEELSKEVGMSRSVFFRRFKQLTGETPLDYLINWRMIKAKQILRTSHESIEQIAVAVGYQSMHAFNRMFKVKVGITPGAYRAKTSDALL